ncbi:hypothetical protein NC651_012244 [Populus alba x Populus x berolinensis]|nr:hypothetical protein NC651_012244 [Populus alba x Populus x berolinensis]
MWQHFILIMNGQLGRQSVYSIYALETNQHSLISHIAGELEFWVPQNVLELDACLNLVLQAIDEKIFGVRSSCKVERSSMFTGPRGIEEANGLCKFNFIPCLMMMFKMVQGSRLWKP